MLPCAADDMLSDEVMKRLAESPEATPGPGHDRFRRLQRFSRIQAPGKRLRIDA